MRTIYRALNVGIQISFTHSIYFHHKQEQLCRPTNFTKMKTAFHEAGHVVCAYNLGLRVTGVHLCNSLTESNDNLVGQTYVEAHTENYFEDHVENTIKLYTAGLVVEYLLYNRDIPANWPLEWYNGQFVSTSDWLTGLNISEILDESDLYNLRQYIDNDKLPLLQHQDVKKLPDELKQSWLVINRVATALMNLGSLTGNNLLIVLSDNYCQYIGNIFKELLRSHSEIIIY